MGRFRRPTQDPTAVDKKRKTDDQNRIKSNKSAALAASCCEALTAGWDADGPLPQVVHAHLFALLQRIPDDDAFKSVRPNVSRNLDEGPQLVSSFVIGQNPRCPQQQTRHMHDPLIRQVNELLRQIMDGVDPRFVFDAITVNRNLQCARHMDEKNAGLSYIFAVGAYTGGGLLVEPPGVDDPTRARLVDIRARPFAFEGHAQFHETEAFEGTRWSVVCYSWHNEFQVVSTRTPPAADAAADNDDGDDENEANNSARQDRPSAFSTAATMLKKADSAAPSGEEHDDVEWTGRVPHDDGCAAASATSQPPLGQLGQRDAAATSDDERARGTAARQRRAVSHPAT